MGLTLMGQSTTFPWRDWTGGEVRIAEATRETVPEGQRATFDYMVKVLGPVVGRGPASVLIHVPEAHRRYSELMSYFAKESTLSKRVRELAILVVGREMDSQFIWDAHAATARQEGIRDDIVDALRDGNELVDLSAQESAIVSYGQEFFRNHQVSRGAFQVALEQLGVQGLVELTLLMGSYSLVAFLNNVFDVDLPAKRTEPLLPMG